MLLSLQDGVSPPAAVGGKSASLMKLYSIPGLSHRVPRGYALPVDFFEPWVVQVVASSPWTALEHKLGSSVAAEACGSLKEMAQRLPLTPEQKEVLQHLRGEISQWPRGLAAVRSSAPDEDGTGKSFAGAFETVLGVTAETLEGAVRKCFASAFDHRVFAYAGAHRPSFAAVVMEMVDAQVAGVAFSANPLNSDLDEMLVDSSWGLGESVVDGSIVADRFLWDKVGKRLLEKKLGSKLMERRLLDGGGIETRNVSEELQRKFTLSPEQVAELGELVVLIERVYGMPMDTEWAHTPSGELKLLQARPITTLFPLDRNMVTPPCARRMLYYDFNVASEATTMSPFTHMDITIYSHFSSLMFGGVSIPDDPAMPLFNGATRQFVNFSLVLKFARPGWFASKADVLDPYLGALLRSDELSRKKYRCRRLPSEVTCRNTLHVLKKSVAPYFEYAKYQKRVNADPVKTRADYDSVWQKCDSAWRDLERRGATLGLQRYCHELMDAYQPVLNFLMGGLLVILGMFNELDTARRFGKTAERRDEADALCCGYKGDEIMETNIAMYHLAGLLPAEVWSKYAGKLNELAARIASNLEGGARDLPPDFLESWRSFMCRFGYDGSDQMFVSSPRYIDTPEVLLARLQHSVGGEAKDPAQIQQEMLRRRREVMTRRLAAASTGCFAACRSPSAKRYNLILDHWMCLRNTPKLHLARMIAMVRAEVLQAQDKLLAEGRLCTRGDVFHLKLVEVDIALSDSGADFRQAISERKTVYERAVAARRCPIFVDSRCRILKPNAVKAQPGTLVGTAVSPGVATGRVRLVRSPAERLEPGEVLVTIVADPAWTPLFVSASAIVLQIGGALQHGALCARELGKPAVSGIEIDEATLRTGMLVEVDGNTGTVKILESDLQKRPSRHLTSSDLTSADGGSP